MSLILNCSYRFSKQLTQIVNLRLEIQQIHIFIVFLIYQVISVKLTTLLK